MYVKYKFVDADGDEIDTSLFSRHVDIPVKVRSVEFVLPDVMIMTLEYLHGK